MTWARRSYSTRSDESSARVLPVEMQEIVKVIAVREFRFGDRLVAAGDVLTMPRHQAEYAKFLGLIDIT